MRTTPICTALLWLGLSLSGLGVAAGHDQPESKAAHKPAQPAPTPVGPHPQEPSLKEDPAKAFAILIESVMGMKQTVELTELSRYPDLFQLLTAPPGGRYVVKQLVLAKGDEVRALSVGVHPPHDVLLTRGKEGGSKAFEGIYYVIDRAGWLKGAALREGATMTELMRGDVWQAYEAEKSFWIWQAEQTAARRSGR